MKQRSFTVLAMFMLFLVSVSFPVNADALHLFGTGWTAQYWNNTILSGSPVLSQVLTGGINFNWGTSSPAPGVINNDNFSARYSSVQHFNAGTYEFIISSDDGVRVFVDGVLVLDQFVGRVLTTDRFQLTITAGTHALVVEYFEGIDQAAVQLQWFQLSGARGSISGTVTDTQGTPLEDILVTSDVGEFFACTNANGEYSGATLLDVPLKFSAVAMGANKNTCNFSSNAAFVREWWQEQRLAADATPITLTTVNPNQSNVNFTLEAGAIVNIDLLLQERAAKPHVSWQTTAHVLLIPDTPTLPTRDRVLTSDSDGAVQLTAVAPGTYTLWVKGDGKLASAQTVTLTAGENNISIGPLREGDTDGNGLVNILDFSILATAFGKMIWQVGYVATADFNTDFIINIADFALLAASFGQSDDNP